MCLGLGDGGTCQYFKDGFEIEGLFYILIMYTINMYGEGKDSAQNSSLRFRLLRDRT